MEENFEWEIIETSKTGDIIPRLPRKICRASILARMEPVWYGVHATDTNTGQLEKEVYSSIPEGGITCTALSTHLKRDYEDVYRVLKRLVKYQKVISLRINNKHTRYFKADVNITEILLLPCKLPEKLVQTYT